MEVIVNKQESLRFFGKISASVSHEIKNVFAVINEAAGLLGDLTIMAEKGMPMDPDRLKRVAGSIQGQVQRGDVIVKNMNQLAHSTDEGIHEMDLGQVLELAVALSRRMADMKQMKLDIGAGETVTLAVDPFGLIRLLHEAMVASLEKMAPHATLLMTITASGSGGLITFSVPGQGVALTSDSALEQLAEEMGVCVITDAQQGTLGLVLA